MCRLCNLVFKNAVLHSIFHPFLALTTYMPAWFSYRPTISHVTSNKVCAAAEFHDHVSYHVLDRQILHGARKEMEVLTLMLMISGMSRERDGWHQVTAARNPSVTPLSKQKSSKQTAVGSSSDELEKASFPNLKRRSLTPGPSTRASSTRASSLKQEQTGLVARSQNPYFTQTRAVASGCQKEERKRQPEPEGDPRTAFSCSSREAKSGRIPCHCSPNFGARWRKIIRWQSCGNLVFEPTCSTSNKDKEDDNRGSGALATG